MQRRERVMDDDLKQFLIAEPEERFSGPIGVVGRDELPDLEVVGDAEPETPDEEAKEKRERLAVKNTGSTVPNAMDITT